MKRMAIIVSGYFTSIHKRHLYYFNNAKALADELFVILNSGMLADAKRQCDYLTCALKQTKL
jgi:glycerol-3-phosphate cytidylyltransferase-like family protein